MSENLERLEAQRTALDRRIQAEKSKAKERRRKEETRAKIILGGALLALIRSDPVAAKVLPARVLKLVDERDRGAIRQVVQEIMPKPDDAVVKAEFPRPKREGEG